MNRESKWVEKIIDISIKLNWSNERWIYKGAEITQGWQTTFTHYKIQCAVCVLCGSGSNIGQPCIPGMCDCMLLKPRKVCQGGHPYLNVNFPASISPNELTMFTNFTDRIYVFKFLFRQYFWITYSISIPWDDLHNSRLQSVGIMQWTYRLIRLTLSLCDN